MFEKLDRKIVFFDFDGVIADTFDLSFSLRKKLEPTLTRTQFLNYFHGNIWSVRPARLPSYADIAECARLYEEGLRSVTIRDGLKEVIQDLARSYVLIIISSTPSQVIQRFLVAHGIRDCFQDILGSEIHTDKSAKFMQTLDAAALTAHDAVFVTDTTGDIREADYCHIQSIAVVWGFHPPEFLEKASPACIVHTTYEIEAAVRHLLEEVCPT